MLNTLFGGNPFQGVVNQAGGQFSTENQQGSSLFGQGQGITNQLSPYFSNLLNNPQGLGATTMSQLMTQAGQGTAGATGAAARTAQDIAARTGNTAAAPGAVASADKAGMATLSGVQNNLAIKNAMDKQTQQQEGAAGLSGLLKGDLSGAEGFEGLANSALNTELNAKQDQYGAEKYGAQNAMKGIQSIGSMIATLM